MPDTYTLAAAIAEKPLAELRRLLAAGGLELEEYRECVNDALDEALNAATVAIWNHTSPEEAIAELEAANA